MLPCSRELSRELDFFSVDRGVRISVQVPKPLLDTRFSRISQRHVSNPLVFRRVAKGQPVAKSLASPHGRKYIVEGRIETPGGRTPLVRTVWIVDQGFDTPRLVTAYPQEE